MEVDERNQWNTGVFLVAARVNALVKRWQGMLETGETNRRPQATVEGRGSWRALQCEEHGLQAGGSTPI
ncbi:hypothetical protein GCM10023217_33820 [Gordonia alkaliphila]|uniref:Transposase n=1 Tax=Gordonia alkaliphila TaxID=1053547 RepID=A0ABP8ZKI8_9ACTN